VDAGVGSSILKAAATAAEAAAAAVTHVRIVPLTAAPASSSSSSDISRHWMAAAYAVLLNTALPKHTT
jgi:hypothetical protein